MHGPLNVKFVMVTVANKLKGTWKKRYCRLFYGAVPIVQWKDSENPWKTSGQPFFGRDLPNVNQDATATFRTIQAFTRTHRATPDTSVRLPISRLVFVARTSRMQVKRLLTALILRASWNAYLSLHPHELTKNRGKQVSCYGIFFIPSSSILHLQILLIAVLFLYFRSSSRSGTCSTVGYRYSRF